MKKNHLIGLILLIAVVGLVVASQSKPLKCPDEYATSEESITAFQRWTNEFYDQNPNATLAEYGEARHTFYEEHNCIEALKRQDEYYTGNADPETLKVIEEAIREATQ